MQAVPKTVSRFDHLENGVLALVDAWSETGARRDPIAMFTYGAQERVFGHLRKACNEFVRAALPSRRAWRNRWLILVGIPAAAAAIAIVARQARTDAEPDDPGD